MASKLQRVTELPLLQGQWMDTWVCACMCERCLFVYLGD